MIYLASRTSKILGLNLHCCCTQQKTKNKLSSTYTRICYCCRALLPVFILLLYFIVRMLMIKQGSSRHTHTTQVAALIGVVKTKPVSYNNNSNVADSLPAQQSNVFLRNTSRIASPTTRLRTRRRSTGPAPACFGNKKSISYSVEIRTHRAMTTSHPYNTRALTTPPSTHLPPRCCCPTPSPQEERSTGMG